MEIPQCRVYGNWEYNATFSGIAQGSGISTILANIYLNEFDRFMEDYKKGFDKGTGRKRNNEYSRKQSYRQRCKAKIRKEWDGYSDTEKQEAVRRLSELKRQFQKIPMGFRRVKYALGRYADIIPEYEQMNKPKELFFRYKANVCEMCGAYVSAVKVYQVKSMSDLDVNTEWGAIMNKKKRKTLVVCGDCYDRIHK